LPYTTRFRSAGAAGNRRRNGYRPGGGARRRPAEALTDIEAHRDEETGDERVGQHPADHDGAEDPASNRAGTGGGPQRHAAQDERERGHEEGAPTHTDAFERGVDERHTTLVRDLGELDDEDRVLGGEADHHQQADLRKDVELEA